MILQIHDELLFEMPKKEVEHVAELVARKSHREKTLGVANS